MSAHSIRDRESLAGGLGLAILESAREDRVVTVRCGPGMLAEDVLAELDYESYSELDGQTLDIWGTMEGEGDWRLTVSVRPPGTVGCEALRAWRLREELTQIQAAELLGIAQPKLSDYERGVTRPELDTAVRIERVAGIPPSAWVAG